LGCAAHRPPLPTVERVDLSRYMGTWHEIARLPARFQEGCADATADYSLLPDGRVRVVNRCLRPDKGGRVDEAVGTAWVADKDTNAKLKVRFFWPFRGDYWIVELGKEYEYAVVGEPGRRYLWILSRTPEMDAAKLDGILSRLPALGFDTGRLIFNRKRG
jgi:apolipoprotein D and lipocalin family protein